MMSREIKFRAWNAHTNKWVNLHGIESMGCYELFNGNLSLDSSGDWKWQQYTGLKDKNGKEIYEGDIVHVEDKGGTLCGDSPVGYGRAGFMLTSVSGLKWNLSGLFETELEVIGNIYENLELLSENR